MATTTTTSIPMQVIVTSSAATSAYTPPTRPAPAAIRATPTTQPAAQSTAQHTSHGSASTQATSSSRLQRTSNAVSQNTTNQTRRNRRPSPARSPNTLTQHGPHAHTPQASWLARHKTALAWTVGVLSLIVAVLALFRDYFNFEHSSVPSDRERWQDEARFRHSCYEDLDHGRHSTKCDEELATSATAPPSMLSKLAKRMLGVRAVEAVQPAPMPFAERSTPMAAHGAANVRYLGHSLIACTLVVYLSCVVIVWVCQISTGRTRRRSLPMLEHHALLYRILLISEWLAVDFAIYIVHHGLLVAALCQAPPWSLGDVIRKQSVKRDWNGMSAIQEILFLLQLILFCGSLHTALTP